MTADAGGPQEAAAPEAVPSVPSVVADESAEAPVEDARVTSLETQLGERTADLQRLQAEYLNYKRRVDRDRQVVRETAMAGVLSALLPVLDDLDRARAHGELEGGFKAVADSLERIVTTLGLERFGEPGEPFDPRIHEALMHDFSDAVAGPTATAILQPGYRVGERVVRPARVAVAEPVPASAAPEEDAVPAAEPTPEPEGDVAPEQPVQTGNDG